MGRHLKNTTIRSGSYAAGVPVGTSTLGPDNPVDGQMRYNDTTNTMEFYASAAWHGVAREGVTTVVKDELAAGDASTVNFTMSSTEYTGKEASALVFVNTVWQNPGTNYTFNNNTTITFTSAPANLAVIVVLHDISSTTIPTI
jgi:hypothetical protein